MDVAAFKQLIRRVAGEESALLILSQVRTGAAGSRGGSTGLGT